MTPEEFKLQKAQAIAKCVIDAATSMNKAMVIAHPSKRAFRNKDKKKIRLKRRARVTAEFQYKYVIPRFTEITLAIIMAQPFPKYPPGGYHPGGLIGESGPEIIMPTNEGSITQSDKLKQILKDLRTASL